MSMLWNVSACAPADASTDGLSFLMCRCLRPGLLYRAALEGAAFSLFAGALLGL